MGAPYVKLLPAIRLERRESILFVKFVISNFLQSDSRAVELFNADADFLLERMESVLPGKFGRHR